MKRNSSESHCPNGGTARAATKVFGPDNVLPVCNRQGLRTAETLELARPRRTSSPCRLQTGSTLRKWLPRDRTRLGLCLALLAFAAFLPAASAQVAPPPALLVAPANLTAPVATPSVGVVQRTFTGVNTAVLKQLESGQLRALRLPFFASGDHQMTFTGREDHGPGRFALTGTLDGVSPSRVVLAVWDGVVTLEAHGEQVKSIRMRFAGNGGYWLEELNPAAQGSCGTEDRAAGVVPRSTAPPAPAPEPAAPAKGGAAKAWDGNHWADLLAYYTPGARDAAGGDAAMQAIIASRVATANSTHTSSGTGFRIRLIGMFLMNYTVSTTGSDLLGKLGNLSDGAMDSVGPDITTYGPDLIHLWATFTDGGSLNGIAYLADQFGVNRWDQPDLTFTHESGHNLGCRHQSANDPTGPFQHAFQATYDWYFLGIYDYTSQAESVMWSTSTSTRIDRFSSPNQQVNFTDIFYGTATVTLGDANNDNKRYIVENRAATVTRREPLFYLFPGSGAGQATPNSPSGTLADVYDTWLFNTRIGVNSNAVLRLWQGNYPNPGRVARKGRLENWGNAGVARIGP